jgi:hypothetical protein
MTSIASGSYQSVSPLLRELSSQVSAGRISSADQGKLSTALDSIGSALDSDQASGTLSTGDLKSRVSALLDGYVQDGTLSSTQAQQVKDVFEGARPSGPGPSGGPSGPGPSGGPGGGKERPAPTEASDDSSDTGDISDTTDILLEFLKAVQSSQTSKTSSSYNSTGTSGSSSYSLLLNYIA